jgi:hypothetical protein
LNLFHFIVSHIARHNFLFNLQNAFQSFMHIFLINFPLCEISYFVVTLSHCLFVVLLIEIGKRLETVMVTSCDRLCFTKYLRFLLNLFLQNVNDCGIIGWTHPRRVYFLVGFLSLLWPYVLYFLLLVF